MNVEAEALVHDAPPPKAVLQVLNPLNRFLLRTPISRFIAPFALLQFSGRRSGQRRRVVVGWHLVDGVHVVLTPATWRINFAGGWPATVSWRGRSVDYVGTLDQDPVAVAAAVNTLLRNGTSARSMGLRMPHGHTVTSDDMTHARRALVRFESNE